MEYEYTHDLDKFSTDHQGNVRVVSNQNGEVEQMNHYYPYGGLKSLMYIFTIVLALCFVSCDPPIFQIPIDGVYKKMIGVDGGTIDVECKTIGGVSFNIKQVYRVTNPLDINPKNLSIKYKNNDIKYTVYLNGALIDERKKIMNDDTVVVSFTKKVRKNDTIIINFDNFLYCKEKPIKIGDIPFVFNKK